MKKYIKSDSGDFSNIQWKSQPCTISGLNQPSMYYTKDLGNGYSATVKPEYRKKIDVVVWVASIYENNRLCGFESFETAYDAKDWVDYESYEMCIKSVTASTKPVCAEDFSNQDRKWYAAADLQGGDFGMYRLYTADEWLDQACEWSESDGTFDEDYTEQEYREYWGNIIKNNPQDFIDYVADFWELDLVEQGVDGHDFYKEFPEEDTPYGYL